MSTKKSASPRKGAARKPRTIKVVEEPTTEVAAPVESKPARATKPATEQTDKKLSAINAAVLVLRESNEPMNNKQLVEAMTTKGYWTSPGGKTPHATLFSAIQREIDKKGAESRFAKAERGKFSLTVAGANQ